MTSATIETWQFMVEWFDPQPQLKRKYLLKYFVEPHQVEMVDLKSKKLFLKKSNCPPEITVSDFFLGNKINLLARDLEIVDYGDSFTRQKLQHQTQRSIVILTPDSYHNWGKVVDAMINRLNLVKLRMIHMSENQAEGVCQILAVNLRRIGPLARGLCLVLYLHGEDGIGVTANLADNLKIDYSAGENEPALMCPTNGTEVNELMILLEECPSTPTLDNCTCCLIKPHAIKEKNVGKILDVIISQGYELSALETIHFDKIQAEEFLEVYRGVIPDFVDQINHMTSGISIALELRAEDAVTVFRQTAGPFDVSIAKEIRPGTIRALFGIDKIRSAIHCTDLPTDGVYECEYCFNIMTHFCSYLSAKHMVTLSKDDILFEVRSQPSSQCE
eukprot:gene6073-12256_t